MTASEAPAWLAPIARRAAAQEDLTIRAPFDLRSVSTDGEPSPVGKRSAILVLFGEGPQGPDVLLIRRATWLRKHAGQPAFPGGSVEPDDADAVATALREAREETGVDPDGVVVLGALGELLLPASKSVVTPVIGWWEHPSEVFVADAAEVEAVLRAPLRELADPRIRGIVRHPGGMSPAFALGDLVIWGFTGLIVGALLQWLGMEQPWDMDWEMELPPGDSGPVTATVQR